MICEKMKAKILGFMNCFCHVFGIPKSKKCKRNKKKTHALVNNSKESISESRIMGFS